ncbi:ribosome-inactivating family protein (plasmid) [Tistrella bauzanensis]|uniref:Ribosome-inactivating family protein n=1 Tax=Tistrella arctica TaxID=3133430 RepID=A0ABU9YL20_9PROT
MSPGFRHGLLALWIITLGALSPGLARADIPDTFEIELPVLSDSGGRQASTYAAGIQTIRRLFGRPVRADIAELYGTRYTLMYLRQRGEGRVGILIDQSNLYAVAYYVEDQNTLYHAQDFTINNTNIHLLPPLLQTATIVPFRMTTHYNDLERHARQRRDQIEYDVQTLNNIYTDLHDLTDPNDHLQTVARAFLRVATAFMEAARFRETEPGAIQYGIEQALRRNGNYRMDTTAMRLTNTWAAAATLVREDAGATAPYRYAFQGGSEGQVSWTTVYNALQSLALMIAINQIRCGNGREKRDATMPSGVGETYCFTPPRAATLIETRALPALVASMNAATFNALH